MRRLVCLLRGHRPGWVPAPNPWSDTSFASGCTRCGKALPSAEGVPVPS